MGERKTMKTKASVATFINGISNIRRCADAKVVAKMMHKASNKRASLWGPSIIGYGITSYRLANGKQQQICRIGFSPRARALTFYLGTFRNRDGLLKKLGKHRVSKGGCLYINKLEDDDKDVLQEILNRAWQDSGNSVDTCH